MCLVTTGNTGASPQLACGIVNSADGMTTQNVIFVTDDAGYNQVSLQVALTSGNIALSPGTIPDPSSPPDPGAGTTLYIDLGALGLPADVWQRMTFDGAGWAFQKFADQGVAGMTPTTSLALSSGTGRDRCVAQCARHRHHDRTASGGGEPVRVAVYEPAGTG